MQRQQEKKSVQFFLFTGFVGLIVAFYTLWHHVAINANALEQSSFCNISSSVNCDAVALSPYSAIFGYPVAALLVVFYGVLLSLGLGLFFSKAPKKDAENVDGHKLSSSIFALTSFGLLPTFVLAAISFFVLKILCLLCLASYLINIVLWILSLILFRRNPKGHGLSVVPPKSSLVPALIVTALLALSPVMMNGIVGSTGVDNNLLNTVLYQHFGLPPATIATQGFPSIGPDDAKIVVVEYSDFQCPYCARASTVVPEVVRASPGVKFVFKHFPLDPNCNPTMQGRGHPLACVAAKHGHCVFKAKGNDAFFVYEKSVFGQQSQLSVPLIEEIALKSGIGKDELKACVDSPETHASIVAQAEEGKAVGVTGTPAVYVNGRRLEYGSVAKVLKAVLARYSETSANAGQ